jgi:hypothetical protein
MYCGCSESPDQLRLKQYLASINANETTVPGGSAAVPNATPAAVPGISYSSASGTHSIVGGTPREVKEGFCGDGIINGTTEDCDQGAIQNTSCRDYNGTSGEVKCQKNCLYDISDCITPVVDKKIGGRAETCNCTFDTTACRGGCQATAATGQSTCDYICNQTSNCNCEQVLQTNVDMCEVRCACTVDASGTPQCECSMVICTILATINKNIATIVSAH